MMRPVTLAMPPLKPDGLTAATVGSGNNRRVQLTWNDNSINETSFVVQRTTNGTSWTDVGTVPAPLDQPNRHETRAFTDPSSNATTPYQYRVVAKNTVGYGNGMPSMTVQSVSEVVGANKPAAPTQLAASVGTGTSGPRVTLTWRDNATNEAGFAVERSVDGGPFAQLATVPPRSNTGNVTFSDTQVTLGSTYDYRVSAVNFAGSSDVAGPVSVLVDRPPVPGDLTGSAVRQGSGERATLRWTDVAGETGYTLQWSAAPEFTTIAGSTNVAANAVTVTTGTIARQAWYFRIRATNALGPSDWSPPTAVAAAP